MVFAKKYNIWGDSFTHCFALVSYQRFIGRKILGAKYKESDRDELQECS